MLDRPHESLIRRSQIPNTMAKESYHIYIYNTICIYIDMYIYIYQVYFNMLLHDC